jgi:hypothetical protein
LVGEQAQGETARAFVSGSANGRVFGVFVVVVAGRLETDFEARARTHFPERRRRVREERVIVRVAHAHALGETCGQRGQPTESRRERGAPRVIERIEVRQAACGDRVRQFCNR